MRSAALLFPAMLLAADRPPVETSVALHRMTPQSCYCGIRGAVQLRNSSERDIEVQAQLELPAGWRAEPSEWSITVPARGVSSAEIRLWSGNPDFRRQGTLVIALSSTADGVPLPNVSSPEFPLDTVLCMFGEPLCR